MQMLVCLRQEIAFRVGGPGDFRVQATFNGYWGNINIDFATEREQNFG
jgi:hypothetical protein